MAIGIQPRVSKVSAEASLRIDFRSDTVTQPTREMLDAMASAELGDDVLREDPTVNALETEAAAIFGKAAGLFVTSGTQGNLLGLLSLTRPGEEAIVEMGAHVANSEVGGAARLGGITLRPVQGNYGRISPEQVAATVRPDNVHYARTALLCIENTHNLAGGTATTPSQMDALAATARERGLKVHVDGARIFNAAVALDVAPRDLARHADTLTFCLSKGLSAPVGSVLVGGQETIDAARRLRKMVGGGMRQAGVLAAAGIVALRSGIVRLADDHRRARRLATGLADIPGIAIDLETVQTNIVRFDVQGMGQTSGSFIAALAEQGFKASTGYGATGVRMVAHRHVDDAAVEEALRAIQRIASRR